MKKIGIVICVLLSLSVFSAKKVETGTTKFKELELFNKILYLVESSYYRDIDSEKLIHGALEGMIKTLDPHSAFLPKEHFEKIKNDTSGEYAGLGIEVTAKDGQIYVIAPIDDTPAFRAGVLAGDKIVEINGESTLGLTLHEAINKMKGPPQSNVTLGIVRKGETDIQKIKLKRQVIRVRPVKFELLDQNFGYIRLTQFSKKASGSIIQAIKKLTKRAKKKWLKGLVLDLRNNPGGLLDEAVNVSSIFLEDGVVVSTEGRDVTKKEIRLVKKNIYKALNLPLVVLINGASASASEIVAAALQDAQRAVIMGQRSFGKGTVQQVAKVDKENGVKLTVAQYMTRKGRKIQTVGVDPDIVLDEVNPDLYEKSKKNTPYLREIDLRNHLSATIETKEEKKLRIKLEKEKRDEKLSQFRKKRNKKGKDESRDFLKRFNVKNDFQVKMALNQLKASLILTHKETKK